MNETVEKRNIKVQTILSRDQMEAVEEVTNFLGILDEEETKDFKVFIQGAKLATTLTRK